MDAKTWILALALALPAGTAVATEHEVGAYGAILDACFASADGGDALAACQGRMSQTCMDTQDGGQTTLGMSSCLMAEASVWDKYLNSEYKKTMTWARAADEDEAVTFPEFAKRAEALRAAQRAWVAFRDAECGFAYAQWGAGSMRSIAAGGCQTDMTAARTIELRQMREGFE